MYLWFPAKKRTVDTSGAQLEQADRGAASGPVWIVKPVAANQGHGIFMTRDASLLLHDYLGWRPRPPGARVCLSVHVQALVCVACLSSWYKTPPRPPGLTPRTRSTRQQPPQPLQLPQQEQELFLVIAMAGPGAARRRAQRHRHRSNLPRTGTVAVVQFRIVLRVSHSPNGFYARVLTVSPNGFYERLLTVSAHYSCLTTIFSVSLVEGGEVGTYQRRSAQLSSPSAAQCRSAQRLLQLLSHDRKEGRAIRTCCE